jgi:molecular chaperone GrpE
MSSDTAPNPGSGEVISSEEALRQERDDLRDRLLRTAAEFDNYRKRTDRERRDLSDHAAADFAKALLPIIDDLERALAVPVEPDAGVEQLTAMRNGVEMVHRQFLEALQRRGIEPIPTVGESFDPEWHEALAAEPAEGRRDGEIIEEIRRGYRMGSRLLRASLVKVAQS